MDRTIACTLSGPDPSRQQSRWHELAARTRVERSELPTGLRLVFGDAPGIVRRLKGENLWVVRKVRDMRHSAGELGNRAWSR